MAAPSPFRNTVEEGGRFAPEAGRYHLYVAYACPWAARALGALYLKGLEDAISVSVVHPTWQRTKPDDENDTHTGWVFRDPADGPIPNAKGNGSFPSDGCIPDPLYNSKTIRELYERAGATAGPYSVPVLWDKKEGTIVNNESADLLEIFNDKFNNVAKKADVNLFPADLKEQIDEYDKWILPTVSTGFYKVLFSKDQASYDQAVETLFNSLEKLEGILSKQRYLCGDRLTAADVRLFQPLARMSPASQQFSKTAKKTLDEFPGLWGYTRDLIQNTELGKTFNHKHNLISTFSARADENPTGIIPVAKELNWDLPANREGLGK